MKKKFYITTAIDYVNSSPHIGTAYEKIGADVIARFKRLEEYDVHFQMGNDEHSVNVKKAAVEKGEDPKKYCDSMRVVFEDAWKALEISNDDFIQTSEPRHAVAVTDLFKKIHAAGDIYKSSYEGWYCESCEAFFTEKDLVDKKCPNHKSVPRWLKEDNYFFALSKYRQKLLDHVKKHPEFILPEYRRNEVVRLIEGGLEDISVSRSTFDWGIPLPIDGSHVVYVWFDALINYISAVGYSSDPKMFKKWWPADMHLVGKDITRFHCVIWPAMLMSAGVPLPRTVFAHGFVTSNREKMSKSIGNVVSPFEVVNKFGADALRYYLLRDAPYGRDADFTWEHFHVRYNSDLANGIGNLVSRTVGMINRFTGGKITPAKITDKALEGTIAKCTPLYLKALKEMDGEIEFNSQLANVWEIISATDRYINERAPWEMKKKGDEKGIIDTLAVVTESIRIVAILLIPFMPTTARRIWDAMGYAGVHKFEDISFDDIGKMPKKSLSVAASAALFPRFEGEKNVAGHLSLDAGDRNETKIKIEEKKMEPTINTATTTATTALVDLIDIADFARVALRVALVKEAEKIEGADKLLKLKVDLGNEERQIVAGIAKHYTPEDLIGKKVIVVVNLNPVKLKGVESNGMLLAASDENTVSILTPLKDVAVGSKVK